MLVDFEARKAIATLAGTIGKLCFYLHHHEEYSRGDFETKLAELQNELLKEIAHLVNDAYKEVNSAARKD